jgi:hypothetical protein
MLKISYEDNEVERKGTTRGAHGEMRKEEIANLAQIQLEKPEG